MAALTSTFLAKSTDLYSPSLSAAKVNANPRTPFHHHLLGLFPFLLTGRDRRLRRGGHVTITCRKKELHPEFRDDAKVSCNGELLMTTGGTQMEYVVDVWSCYHPFYLGNRSGFLVDADHVGSFGGSSQGVRRR
ncbi:hypothetical protein MLD38_012902 [Melastoma candidum]|uniref:Uncharacterized protein n=1 Tax=Melastoma candidum TaxID=119954 RepID=A0ACB9RBH2_9MYRT|nr:hypothetical protein MLD38_012902 [Melastoma candidum]